MNTAYYTEGDAVHARVMHKSANVKDKIFINDITLHILRNEPQAINIARKN